jgi:hypothetical protein
MRKAFLVTYYLKFNHILNPRMWSLTLTHKNIEVVKAREKKPMTS